MRNLIKLIFILGFISTIGFIPEEKIFGIQIVNPVLHYCIYDLAGPVGLLGLFVLLFRFAKSFFLIFFAVIGSIILIIVILLSSILPAFKWIDGDVYRNKNDYVVLQERETFVTSNTIYPRLIRTKSPYASVFRIIEEEHRFSSNELPIKDSILKFEGKVWVKEPSSKTIR